jgi:hypothetical protein
MNTIKKVNKTRIKLNGKSYKGYLIGDLPPTFGYISREEIDEFGNEQDVPGIKSWFNYKGLTYV